MYFVTPTLLLLLLGFSLGNNQVLEDVHRKYDAERGQMKPLEVN